MRLSEEDRRTVNPLLWTLGTMVKQHGAKESVVVQLLCFHRLLVLHLAACSAVGHGLRHVTVDMVLIMDDFWC